jgi:diaminopimelate epimerase
VREVAIPYVKGHGTENDFVLLPDVDGELTLTSRLVAAICDRRAGVGGDGVLRVVRSAKAADAVDLTASAEWFMDYRNADGSTSEMCGNGIRVFARYLLDSGLAAGPKLPIATRGGVRDLTMEDDGTVSVDMGVAQPIRSRQLLRVATSHGMQPATGLFVPNPHLVCFVDDLAAAGLLNTMPQVSAPDVFPDGVNIEYVVERGPQHLAMRVWERGVGETRSCGTGACAAAVVAMWRHQAPPATAYQVDVPGGTLTVTRREDDHLVLNGPAVLVSAGVLRPDWVAANS